MTFVGPLIVAALMGAVWRPLSYAFWVLWPVALLATIFNDDQELKCPWCSKRVKLGAAACHHCGRIVAASVRP